MRNYFVFVKYYLPNSSSPIDCESILMTGYDDCLTAWKSATKHFNNHMKEKGYAKFIISDFKEVK